MQKLSCAKLTVGQQSKQDLLLLSEFPGKTNVFSMALHQDPVRCLQNKSAKNTPYQLNQCENK